MAGPARVLAAWLVSCILARWMKRVLFVIKAREFGGLEVVLLDWLSQIDFDKVSAVLCCYGTDTLQRKLRSIAPRAEIVPMPVQPDANPFAALPKWARLFTSIRADKIVFLESAVADFGGTPLIAAWLAAPGHVILFEASWGRAVIASQHPRKLHYGFLPGLGLYRRAERLLIRGRSRLAKRTFVVSEGLRDKLFAHYGYPRARTSILYHGVNTNRFRASTSEREQFRDKNSIPQDATLIVNHCRLVRIKRVDRLVGAFEQLRDDPRVWLVLTCYGPLENEIKRMVADSPARARIRLVGFQEDSTAILSAGDIFCLTSDDEGFGIALVEALSSGLICVATNSSGPKEILAGGEFGFLVEPTVEGVRGGIQRALALTRAERTRMVERARSMVQSRFEVKKAIQTALDALEIPRRK